MKTDQDPAFFRYVANRQARPVSVAPIRPVNRPEHHLRPDLSDVAQIVFQNALLGCDLCCRIQMLHCAAAANAEVNTFWFYPQSGFTLYFDQGGGLPFRLPAERLKADSLTGQRAFYKNNLAWTTIFVPEMPDTASLHVERFNIDNVV